MFYFKKEFDYSLWMTTERLIKEHCSLSEIKFEEVAYSRYDPEYVRKIIARLVKFAFFVTITTQKQGKLAIREIGTNRTIKIDFEKYSQVVTIAFENKKVCSCLCETSAEAIWFLAESLYQFSLLFFSDPIYY